MDQSNIAVQYALGPGFHFGPHNGHVDSSLVVSLYWERNKSDCIADRSSGIKAVLCVFVMINIYCRLYINYQLDALTIIYS